MNKIKNSLVELWKFRELIFALTQRELKVRYKQTLLGASWAILQPAALTIIFTVVFGNFLKVDSGTVPYPIFAYSALLPWTFFTNSVTFGSLSVVNNGSLVSKVYFPREILPIASVAAAFFDFLIAGVIFLLMMYFYKIHLTANILLIVIIVPTILMFTLGISFILSALNVIFRDIKFIVPLGLQVLLYISPIIYSTNQVPDNIRPFYVFNPIAPLIQSFRDVTIVGSQPIFKELYLSVILSFLTLLVGYVFFKYKEKIFADVI